MFEVGFWNSYLIGVVTMLVLGHERLSRAGEPKCGGSQY
jgi:Sec-independent protein translocase protein TatA